jgi:DNA-binding SARP family transcriptional activator
VNPAKNDGASREDSRPAHAGAEGAASLVEPPIRLHLLGSLRLTGSAASDAILAQPRRAAVLAHIGLMQRSGFVRRDVLAALFWPEHDSAHARAALRKAVHGLREGLGESSVIARGDEEIRLDPGVVWCDVTAFWQAMSAQDHERALALYQGPLLDGFFADAPQFERMVESERRAVAEAAAEAAWQLADGHERSSQPTLATRWARKAARMGGADERLVRKAMDLLRRQGDVAGALALYAEFASELATQYDAEPSAETQALARSMRTPNRTG